MNAGVDVYCSQQRSALPLPEKRYVEPSDSSASSSDDEPSSPVSQNTSHLTDDSQNLEVCTTLYLWFLSHSLCIAVVSVEPTRL